MVRSMARHVRQHPRPEPERVPRRDRVTEHVLVERAAGEIRPRRGVDPLACRRLEVPEPDDSVEVDRRGVGGQVVAARLEVPWSFPQHTGGMAIDPRLHDAARAGDVAAIGRLLADGLPIDARDTDGRTPVMVATVARQTEAVRALVDAEADVDIRDNRLDNVFLYAGADGLLDILRIANEAGADPAITNRFGGTRAHPRLRARLRRDRPLPARRSRTWTWTT